MSGTWHKAEHEHEWHRAELAPVTELLPDGVQAIERFGGTELASKVFLYCRDDADGRPACLLFAPLDAGITVNGEPVTTGVRVLSDRDVIGRPGSADVYFSSESLVRVEPFPGPGAANSAEGEATYCPRCRRAIDPGYPAVSCPGCSTWFHQNPEEARDCWSFSPTCGVCQQDTDLANARYRWTPESI